MQLLFKQLEFAFHVCSRAPVAREMPLRLGVVGQALRVPVRAGRAVTRSATDAVVLQFRGRDHALEEKSRHLLRELGAGKLAREIRVEWNPRMRTAAGRADFRAKLISLNPLLCDLGNGAAETDSATEKLDRLKRSSLTSGGDSVSAKNVRHEMVHDELDRTLRHELAHLLAQFRVGRRRIAPHGSEWGDACRDLEIGDEVRCHNLPFATRAQAVRFVYRCPNCRQKFPRVRRALRAVACLACCRKHNGGDFDARFRLKLICYVESRSRGKTSLDVSGQK
jgi:predicted SprT family Zn-dependent metalloprotease